MGPSQIEAAEINIPLHEDYFDNEADSPLFQIEAYHSQTQRKIEEFSDIWAFDELI